MKTFSEALEAIKAGRRVARQGWTAKPWHLELQRGTIDADMVPKGAADAVRIKGLPYYMFEVGVSTYNSMPSFIMVGQRRRRWHPTAEDLLAEDWIIY